MKSIFRSLFKTTGSVAAVFFLIYICIIGVRFVPAIIELNRSPEPSASNILLAGGNLKTLLSAGGILSPSVLVSIFFASVFIVSMFFDVKEGRPTDARKLLHNRSHRVLARVDHDFSINNIPVTDLFILNDLNPQFSKWYRFNCTLPDSVCEDSAFVICVHESRFTHAQHTAGATLILYETIDPKGRVSKMLSRLWRVFDVKIKVPGLKH